ncbi:hypothetical protein C0W80_15195 [Photobacterium leiognathi subsp. mandapamensis]|uniref:hypothetical protein n=1 Tax=Photobacterium leiognathi TaxID=553611 RepID=UPI000D166402|nr:hypothetical protein [Photobacterium leiognathi]PSU98318.1 hypothetical protein C0W80_15195 [Photobacterium leiognathi subsp. mandapamensis]
MYESALSNLLLVSLVTGLETYLKTRFTELYQEGVLLESNSLVKCFSKKEERIRDVGLLNSDDSLMEYANKKINFQNYKHIKDAYKAFGVRLHEQIDNDLITKIKKLISYRHKIIHFSISLGILDINEYREEPVLPSKTFIEKSIKEFDEFIMAVHRASIKR